jgi:hypothetical protein
MEGGSRIIELRTPELHTDGLEYCTYLCSHCRRPGWLGAQQALVSGRPEGYLVDVQKL